MWPTEDSTMKSAPKMDPIVFAFAGDSTITSALPTSTTSLPHHERHGHTGRLGSVRPPVLAKGWTTARHRRPPALEMVSSGSIWRWR